MLKRKTPLTIESTLSRAATLCARCEQCSPDILKKLLAWGLSASDAEKVIAKLEDMNFLDDMRFAKAYAHDKLHFCGWGRRKIQQGLWAKRLPRAVIEHSCDELDDDSDSYRVIAEKVIKAKARQLKEQPLSRESKIKLVKFAMTRGFEYSLIVEIMRCGVAMQSDEIE